MNKAAILEMIQKDLTSHQTQIDNLKLKVESKRGEIEAMLQEIHQLNSFIHRYTRVVSGTRKRTTRQYMGNNTPSGRSTTNTVTPKLTKSGKVDRRQFNKGRKPVTKA